MALVPDDASVAATNKAGSHLSARRYFFSVPLIDDVDWVVVDLQDPWVPLPPRENLRASWGRKDPALLVATITMLEESSEWRKIFERSDVFVFQRLRS